MSFTLLSIEYKACQITALKLVDQLEILFRVLGRADQFHFRINDSFSNVMEATNSEPRAIVFPFAMVIND